MHVCNRAEWVSMLDWSCLTKQFPTVLGVQVSSWTVLTHVRKQPHQSAPQLIKRLGGVPSYLCDWHILKNMCGQLEHAQPPYFYLPDVSV